MSTLPRGREETHALLTPAGLRHAVAALIGVDGADLADDDDLIGVGIDSIGMMQLANQFRAAGIEIRVAELMDEPTLGAWLSLAGGAAAPAPAGRGAAPPDATPALDESRPFPLAPMQHAYWVGRIGSHPLSVASHFYCEFDGTGIDPDRLEHAARALTRRHPMLRARFLEDGRQQILPESPWRGVTRHDLTAADPEGAAIRDRESNRRLAVDAGEVFDIQVSRLPGGRSRLHLNVDMLVADAMSFRIFLDELAQVYADPEASLPPVDYDVVRYHADVAAQLAEARAAAAEHWRARIDTLPLPPQLPLATDPAALDSPRVTRREHWLSSGDYERLRDLCKARRVTIPMALAAAFAEVLGRWSAEPRFLLNLPLFDRRVVHPGVPRLVGDFTSLLLLGVDVAGELPFAERARRVQDRFRSDVRHADYSGIDVLRDLARRQPGLLPSAPVVFTSALGMGDLFGTRVRQEFGSLAWMISQTSQVWLDHQVTEDDGRLLLNWDAVESLFPPGCLDAMFDAYVAAVRWLLAPGTDWEKPLPAALPAAQAATRARVNDTAGEVPAAALHDAFFVQAERRPDALALAWGTDGRMTYGELAANARDLAARLRLAPGEPVAVTIPKGPRQVVAVLGVLLAGGTYVPVGVDLPAARRDRVYARAGVRVVITSEGPVAIGDTVPPAGDGGSGRPGELAYTIFTSGSTGEPKGVMVPHRAAVNTVTDLNERCGIGPTDRVLAVSALDFDLSVYDIFGLLSAGGAVVLVDEDSRRDAARWVELVRRWGVTVWQSVPALLDMLLVAAEDGLGPDLRIALVGGDWPGLDLRERLSKRAPGCRLIALGGTTETTIHSTWFEVERCPPEWHSVPWGTPLRNVRCRVVDQRGRDCPDWVPGELWIGGGSVALGYRGDPELTARRFVQHDGGRWYRTGDMARYWPDGTLEFLGRRDHQVKIRGHRIELGDVETAFERCPGVTRAVAVGIGERGHQQLAVAVLADGAEPDALRRAVAEQVPGYMVPEHVAVFDRLPLSANGKLDRAAIARLLTDHRAAGPGAAAAPPDGPAEEAIAGIWSRLLGVTDVRRDQSFFTLGGDSLLATRFVQEARRSMGVEIPLRQLFDTPTIADLAAGIAGAGQLMEEGVL
jgi:yersiniabactin nonribosomal peptide synthetase